MSTYVDLGTKIITTAIQALFPQTMLGVGDYENQSVFQKRYQWAQLYELNQNGASQEISNENNKYEFSPLIPILPDGNTPSVTLTEESNEIEISAVTVKDMVLKIKSVFGLNNVQVAQVVGVSRPSLYNHIRGTESPQSLDRYQEVYNLALKVNNTISYDIRRGLKTVLIEGKTLLGYLKESRIDHTKVLEVCNLIAIKMADQASRNFPKLTASQQRESSRRVSRGS